MTLPAGGNRWCRRCGTCCRNGGPALHRADRRRVQRGWIALADLVTLRPGELARDNVRGGLVPLDQDLIKIKGRGAAWTCRFYDPGQRGCRIYARRPLECRLLACWDTAALEAVYARTRLQRRDLLGEVAGVWEVVSDHQRRCDWRQVRALAPDCGDGPQERPAAAAVRAMVAYDTHLRQLIVERHGVDRRLLDFLLGRPMSRTLSQAGLRIAVDDGGADRVCRLDSDHRHQRSRTAP